MKAKLEARKDRLWTMLEGFVELRDAHGVHDMAVEIQGIEIVLRELGPDVDPVLAIGCRKCGQGYEKHYFQSNVYRCPV